MQNITMTKPITIRDIIKESRENFQIQTKQNLFALHICWP